MALRNGTRPKMSATTTEIPKVKSSTVVFGARLRSSSDHLARAPVAQIANSHPKAAPVATSKKLSANSCRNMRVSAAKGHAQAELSLSRCVSRNQQHRDISAGDHEH
ncbi:MAG: hypothetical protein DMG64_14345 [Acidobacteria bacterium]|nr:MAG: hypothetical protein DMG63_06700 [Acidobacteriota bacterium]PYY01444.1 MAG: hypothetical protein DMG64_14345 [Acidobacteriota bacterium]PYY24209.1 MAG: hypothetical protein DMG62_04175 [Acidobacteriota bacterium]